MRRIVTGVSCSARLFAGAIKRRADTIIVHHGLFWKGDPHPFYLTGIMRSRVKMLLQSDLNLLAYHLPLDGHPNVGNNMLIAKALGLKDVRFIESDSKKPPMLVFGSLKHEVPFDAFSRWTDEIMGSSSHLLQLGKSLIQNVAVVSGSGGGFWREAAAVGADVLVTGEVREEVIRAAEEVRLNLCACGHYNTEKWGVRALGEHLASKFGLEVEFVDIPNPI